MMEIRLLGDNDEVLMSHRAESAFERVKFTYTNKTENTQALKFSELHFPNFNITRRFPLTLALKPGETLVVNGPTVEGI
jgi:hypothetical protein